MDRAVLQIGAVAFIHRFCSSLNEHVHFHVCVVDGVFVGVAGDVILQAVTGIDEAAVTQMQATLRRCTLRAFVGRGLLESCDAKEMLGYQHSGFSVDAGAPAALLLSPSLCLCTPAQRGIRFAVPLRETTQRAWF